MRENERENEHEPRDLASGAAWSSEPTEPGAAWLPQPQVPLTSWPATPPDDAPTLVPMSGSDFVPLPPPVEPPPAKPTDLSRRAVLIGAGAGVVGVGALGAGIGFVLSHRGSDAALPNVYSSQAAQIGHLLRRAGFGPAPADYATYLNAGVQGSIDRLLNPSAVADTLETRLAATPFDFTKADDVVRWALLRMIYSNRPLQEKLAFFWHGVLTSSFRKIGGKQNYALLPQYYTLLVQKGLGRFDDLIAAVSTEPAMLWWLDGRVSTGKSPNENYSRELMELFTMGLDTYTQNDVHQGALALTGWTIRNGKGVFVPSKHFDGEVTFLGQTGKMDLSDVVRLVCAHPTTAKHVAWRMWSFFVYENPSDADLQPLVDAYHHNDHSIAAMVRAMLTSPRFASAQAYRARVKSPVEFVVGALRGLGAQTDGRGLSALLAAMGQVPFDPPNVAGWDGDKLSAAWLSTQSWMSRVNFINLLVAEASGVAGVAGSAGKTTTTATPATGQSSQSSLRQVITQRNLASGKDVADYYIAALADNTLAADRRAILYDAISHAPAPSEPALRLASGQQLSVAAARTMLYLLMAMPEYQMN